jgi:ERCC4-type nuclease
MNKNDYRTTVIADDRERKSEIIQFLSEIENVSVGIQRLSDFALSIIDGRLFSQAIRLVSSKYKSVLILEGTGKELTEIGVRREAMQGALITVSIILGIPVLRSKTPSESARLILYAARQIKSFARGAVQRHGSRPRGKRKRQLFILQGLPDVGSQRAARLLKSFGSVKAVMAATSGELQCVEGIGKHIAEGIRWAVSENIQAYGAIDEWPI